MTAVVWLAVLSVAAVAALFVTLAVFLIRILDALIPTGGSATSLLAKIRLGLRAIEIETGHLPAEATTLNAGLAAVRDGLNGVGADLGRLAAAVQRQEER